MMEKRVVLIFSCCHSRKEISFASLTNSTSRFLPRSFCSSSVEKNSTHDPLANWYVISVRFMRLTSQRSIFIRISRKSMNTEPFIDGNVFLTIDNLVPECNRQYTINHISVL